MPRLPINKISSEVKNYIINSNFDFWQRNTIQTVAGYGSDDRWINDQVGSTKTHSRQAFTLGQTDVPNDPKFFSRTVVASVVGVGNYTQKHQRIEFHRELAGKAITVSFWAKADAIKNIAVDLQQFMGSGGTPSADVLFAPTTFTLTTIWKKFTVTVNVPSLSGKTLGTNNNDSLWISFWFDAGSNFNARTNSLGQQSGTFDIAQVMVSEGSSPVNFKLAGENLSNELSLCQRYYEKSYNIDVIPATLNVQSGMFTCIWTSGNRPYTYLPFKVRKRSIPTIIIYNMATGAILSLRAETGADIAAGVDGATTGDSGFSVFQAVLVSTYVAGAYGHYAADAEL